MRNFYYYFLSFFSWAFEFFTSKRLRVLAYHSIQDPSIFNNQMDYLKRNFNIVSLADLQESFKSHKVLPKNSLLITFDDGYLSVFSKGLGILKCKDIPAVLFVIPEYINSDTPFWWDKIAMSLDGKEGEKMVWEVKKWPNDKREKYISDLEKNEEKKPEAIQLTEEQLIILEKGGVRIANHSFSHPMLDQCSEEKIKQEFIKSKQWLNDRGFLGTTFAYPNGNFSKKVEEILIEEGLEFSFLFDHKINKKDINPFRISRIRVDSGTELAEFRVKVSGLHSFLYHKKKKK